MALAACDPTGALLSATVELVTVSVDHVVHRVTVFRLLQNSFERQDLRFRYSHAGEGDYDAHQPKLDYGDLAGDESAHASRLPSPVPHSLQHPLELHFALHISLLVGQAA